MPTPNPGTRREHKGAASPATLVTAVTATDTTVSISTTTGWPTGAVGSFFVVVDPGKANEEKIRCASLSASVLAVAGSGRGVDGTSAATHQAGAQIYPVWTGVEADEANEHLAATAGVHGVVGSVVGTSDAQTLTGKTISGAANSISNIASTAVVGLDAHTGSTAAHGALVQVVGLTNTQTLTNKSMSGAANTFSNIPQAAVTGLDGHTHGDFAALTHNHDAAYSGTAHAHASYSVTTHNHDASYSAAAHNHSGLYSPLGHTHAYASTGHDHDSRYALYTTGETYGKVAERTVNWALGTGRVHVETSTNYAVWVDSTGLFGRNVSSRRYKKKIRDHEVDPGAVLALRPRIFDRKDGSTADEYGLIAEEVHQHLPEIVVRDQDGKVDGLRYDLLAVALLGVVQDQSKRIAALEAAVLGDGPG